MPKLEDIEQFRRDLFALGREEEALVRWGERAPVSESSEAGSDLGGSSEAEDSETGMSPDFAALLDNLPLGDEAVSAEAASVEDAAGDAGSAADGAPADFSADLGDFGFPEQFLDQLSSNDAASESSTSADETLPAKPRAEESFSMPDFGDALNELSDRREANLPSDDDAAPAFESPPANESLSEDPSALSQNAEETFSVPDAFADFAMPDQIDMAAESGSSLDLPDADEGFDLSIEAPHAEDSGLDMSIGLPPIPQIPQDAVPRKESRGDFSAFETGAAAPDVGDFDMGEPDSPADKESAEALGLRPEPPKFDYGSAKKYSRDKTAPEKEERAREVSLSEGQVDRLQDSLLSYPLNLRLAIEDIVANEKGDESLRSKLIWAMVDGASPLAAAGIASRVLKRRIEIPKDFEKKTGAAFEADKGSFAYFFVHTIFPTLKVALGIAAGLALVVWLGWNFIVKPLNANALYRSGYARIAEDRFPEAEQSFAKAVRLRDWASWYYRYARAYAAKRQYILAEKKYEALMRAHPREYKGAIEWAAMERDQLKYEEASRVIKKYVLENDYLNKDALLFLGDLNLDWAEDETLSQKEREVRHEEARRTYALLIKKYGPQESFMERMLLYFIRTDNMKEVLVLKERFLVKPARTSLGAAVLAELGGYFLDSGRLEDVDLVLKTAVKKDPNVPETHYYLARYFRRSGSDAEERKALDNAVKTFQALPGLAGKRMGMYIDSLIRRGRLRAATGEWIGAEADFALAAETYETALELRRLKKSPRYGEAYAGLAEVAYWQRRDLDTALALYERAAANDYTTPDTWYKRGYILYAKGDFAFALECLYRAGLDDTRPSPYLEYAFGAVLYSRGDYLAAEGSFRRVVEAMTLELQRIDLPDPQQKPSEGEIVRLLMKAQNNLGAALYEAGSRIGDPRRRGDAMAAFAEASRLFDALTRDQVTLERGEAKNLGVLNIDYILHPRRNIDIAVYADLEPDMAFPKRPIVGP